MAVLTNDNTKSKTIAWILLALMGISLGAFLLFKKKDSSVSSGTEVVSDKIDISVSEVTHYTCANPNLAPDLLSSDMYFYELIATTEIEGPFTISAKLFDKVTNNEIPIPNPVTWFVPSSQEVFKEEITAQELSTGIILVLTPAIEDGIININQDYKVQFFLGSDPLVGEMLMVVDFNLSKAIEGGEFPLCEL